MLSLRLSTFIIIINYFLSISALKIDHSPRFVPCFPKHYRAEVKQFDRRVPLNFINCTREVKTHRFTIRFSVERQRSMFDQRTRSDTVITLFSGPCSSSTATLTIGRTFPSIHGSLDESNPAMIVSSHLPWNEQSQNGMITYEYAGASGDFAQLISVLIHVVIRHGRDEMIKGNYLIRFSP